MRLPLLFCVTSLVAAAALAQQEPSSSPSTSPSKSDQSTLSPTGRTTGQQQHFRSQKILGAQVKTSTAEDVGRIEDVILNPASGRIDFAVISAENKLCPVPWQLLSLSSDTSTTTTRPSTTTPTPGTTPSTSIYASAMGQPTFTLNADKSKLQAGPSFDRSRWPEMTASWSQQIYAHYGVQPGSAVGGTGTGATQIDQGGTSTSSSDKTSPDTEKTKK